MSDPFDLLGLPRRPLLSEQEVGSAYRQLAAKHHPDQETGNELLFRELGEAAAILRDPARRLRELSNSPSGSQLPPKAAELFPQIASMLQQANNLIKKQSSSSNALAKALLAAPLKHLNTDLNSTLKHLQEWRGSLDQDLITIDSRWPEHDPHEINTLADSYAYAGRWESQLRERKLSLESFSG
jgi:curved DNA-binding protein CbpA